MFDNARHFKGSLKIYYLIMEEYFHYQEKICFTLITKKLLYFVIFQITHILLRHEKRIIDMDSYTYNACD